jgi:hypothetical protein
MSGNPQKQQQRGEQRRPIVVDGANVAHEECTPDGRPMAANIAAVRDKLLADGYEPIIIVDAALHHRIDDPGLLEEMIDAQEVRQAPAGTDADFFVIKTAEELGAQIVSNDQYKPYRGEYPWVEERRVPLMVIRGTVEIYDPPAAARK